MKTVASIAGPLVAALLCGFCENPSDGSTVPSSSARLVAAGWSFGFCIGPCSAELTISSGSLVYIISSRSGEEVFSSQRGQLTNTGVARLDGLTSALPAGLQIRYGCPDCADGGTGFVVVASESETKRVEYEFGNPPSELADLDGFLKSLMETLAACGATEDLDSETRCLPSSQ